MMSIIKLKAQPYIKLQSVAEEIELENNWDIVTNSFSKEKTLFDYQKEAVENSIKILRKYFEDLNQNKKEFAKIYEDLDIYNNLQINLKTNKYATLLKEFFPVEIDNKGNEYIPFSQVSNRMSFWMATGSGKTIVIIKLIQLLRRLMDSGLIPQKDILFLTYREDLLKVFNTLIEEFNHDKPFNEQIVTCNLKDYEKEKSQRIFGNRIFAYRSDLISDERKENILNFRDYLELKNEKPIGNWYLILDEAHKGDTQDSKRQNIFSILSQNGFLFNFSATFTEPIDIVSTVYNLNLNEFINEGYGKQIYVSQEEIKAFKDKKEKDFNETEKRKIILKNLITLTAVKKAYENVKNKNIYHNPLLIFLMNSVNTKDADLKLVFKEIAFISKNVNTDLLKTAKKEVIKELDNAKYIIGDIGFTLKFASESIKDIESKDIYKHVFNSESSGNIEYIINPNNKQEIALQLDSSSTPFALIKIGDISKWIKDNLTEYKENQSFKDEGYFETLNNSDSSINILLGSRAFYEGWDSNRPNVITFINIGTGTDAKKFILQAIGRGIRIEPIQNQRKRLDKLAINNKELREISDTYKNETRTLETLFIYATNKQAIETILTELEMVKKSEGFEEVSLWKNEKADRLNLLIPVYKTQSRKIINQDNPVKFRMSKANLEVLKLYFELMPVERFLLEYETDYQTYLDLRKLLDKNNKFIYLDESRNFKDIQMLIKALISHLQTKTQDYKEFIPVDDKIVHFKKIKVRSDYKEQFLKVAENITNANELSEKEKVEKLQELITEEYSFERAIKEITDKYSLEQEIEDVKIRKLAQHFYLPLVYSKNKVDWLKHIISVESEYEFIKNLTSIVDELDKHFDWWMFSKLDEHLDKDIYIPYINKGKIKKFIPDFIFWFKKETNYTIFFIDPKGDAYSSYLEKIDGYESIFMENEKEKTFKINKLIVKVKLKLYTIKGKDQIEGKNYLNFWIDKAKLKEELILSMSKEVE